MLGLSSQEHKRRLAICGKNVFIQDLCYWLVKLFRNMIGGFQLFYFAVTILCLMIFFITECVDYQALTLGILSLVVFFIMGMFQFYQDGKSDKLITFFKTLISEKATVIRDGLIKEVPAESLVPGDICLVKGGDKVPADVRILKSSELKVDNSNMT